MFAGLLTLSPALAPEDIVDAPFVSHNLSFYRRPDREGIWQSGPAWLMEQRLFNARESRDEQLPCRCPQSGLVLAFWGRLDNRAEIASRLDIDTKALNTLSDSQLALDAWRRWGEALPEQLLGDYVLAVMDALQHKVFLARDALGVKPLYYFLDSRVLAFATSVAALRAIESLRLTPGSEWMARYLAQLSMSTRDTGYRNVVKLPPGHCLTVESSGGERLRQWFHLNDDAPDARHRDPRWVQAYRERLEQAIRCRMSSDYPLGTENSGGIDSATVTAYLAHFLGEPGNRLHSFGFALCEQEPAFILETSQARRIVHNYLVTAPIPAADEEGHAQRSQRVLGYPEEHANGSLHSPFYRECELRGIRTLFSGFGGDEVVTNSGQLLRFELLDSGRYRDLWDILPGNWIRRGLRLGKAATLGRHKPAYNPELLAACNARWPHQLLRSEVVERQGIHRAYMEDARYDAPYRRINDFILRHLAVAPYISTRFENCTLMAASYGVEYRWPLWDTRLVQQYLSTPSLEKQGPRGIGRYLHRRAVDGVVPSRVAWKPSKDMGYARLQRETYNDIQEMIELARRNEARLHPALDELIQRDKFRQQIKQAAQGSGDEAFTFAFRKNVRAILRLNHWLHQGALD